MTLFDFLQKGTVFSEGLCALVGWLYYAKLKDTYWKYFVWYCSVIFFNELFSYFVLDYYPYFRKYFYNWYGVPIQFLFFFWLYAKKVLQMNRLFTVSVVLYFTTFISTLFYGEKHELINSIGYILGCLLLLIMCVLEFNRQIRSDDIVNFKSNKMFYINLGVILFYTGTMPFYSFYMEIHQYSKVVYQGYSYFSLSADILLYLLFTASFIWGKVTK